MYDNSVNTEFSIEDVQATLETENNRERVEVTPGEYVCEIKPPLPDVRQDAKGHNKILMPIEISGNAQFDGQWLFEAIYMNNQHGYNEVSDIKAFNAPPKPMGAEGVASILAPPIKEESAPIPF